MHAWNIADKTTMKNTMISFMLWAAVLYLALILMTALFQRSLIYFPDTTQPNLTNAPAGTVPITVETADGLTLHAWWLPPPYDMPDDTPPENTPGDTATSDAEIIVFFHGNGGNLDHRMPKIHDMAARGYGILMAEYRGYGINDGKPTEKGFYHDGRAYMDWLLQDKNIPADRIVLYGESLGSGTAVQMATEYDAKALVLDVPFNSTLALAKMRFPIIIGMDFLMKDQFRNDQKIADIDMPVFIGVAGQDMVVPPAFGRALFDAAATPKKLEVYPMAGHVVLNEFGFYDDMDLYLAAIDPDTAPTQTAQSETGATTRTD